MSLEMKRFKFFSIQLYLCVLLLQMLGSPESKPTFLTDKNLEAVVKRITSKFPTIDTKSNSVSMIIYIYINFFSSTSLFDNLCISNQHYFY